MKSSHLSRGQHGDKVVVIQFKSLYLIMKNLCNFQVQKLTHSPFLLQLKVRNLSIEPRIEEPNCKTFL